MIDFGLGTDLPATATKPREVVVQEVVPAITETVNVMPTATKRAGFAMKADGAWGWSDLRDYVIRECERRHGPQVRNAAKESGIFKGFLSRWGDKAPAIARSAFEVHDGMWHNAPITVNRFCAASDPFFAAKIAERL